MNYVIEPTRNTPFVNFDFDAGVFELKGISSPENSLDFYNPIFEAVDNFNNEKLEVNMALEYFNTSSSKCLYQIFKSIKKLHTGGTQVVVNWIYDEEDEDMREVGEDYSDILDLEMNYMALSV
ncbi:MAG: DUF1987 domain-containing protein [bacterium]|jgi:hypothetical protein|nr:DUF1987 domain-containing protein [bacterium]